MITSNNPHASKSARWGEYEGTAKVRYGDDGKGRRRRDRGNGGERMGKGDAVRDGVRSDCRGGGVVATTQTRMDTMASATE